MKDDKAVECLEADFLSEYNGLDLRDLWRKDSGLTARRAISLFRQLPPTSRVWKYLLGDSAEWGYQEHLLADIRDLGMQIAYFSAQAVQVQLKPNSAEQKRLFRGVPTRLPRPGDPKEEIRFATKDELIALFGVGKPRGRRK